MYVVNLFEIADQRRLACQYRLLRVGGIPEGGKYEHYPNQLVKGLSYGLQRPVALLRRSGALHVAIPRDAPLPAPEFQLTPPVALRFLAAAFQSELYGSRELWGDKYTYYWKRPRREVGHMQIFEGFSFRVVAVNSTQLALCLDVTYKYADARWFTDFANGDMGDYQMRHFLYHFGNKWYPVQFLNPTGRSIREQKFIAWGETHLVYDYTIEKCGECPPAWIQRLNPNGPAILYRYPGSQKESYGAAQLCKLLYRTSDPQVVRLHHYSILSPEERWRKILQTVRRHFATAHLGEVPVKLSDSPLRVASRPFPIPSFEFGRNAKLQVKRHKDDEGIPLKRLGVERMNLLSDPQGGTFTSTPFDTQYVLLPTSMPSQIQDDLIGRKTSGDFVPGRVIESVGALYPHPYSPLPILYDDKDRRTLASQVDAIQEALDRANVKRGYVLLVLPEKPHPKLHNKIKRARWSDLQLKCARSLSDQPKKKAIRNFYTQRDDGEWFVSDADEQDYASYLRYLALGILLVNRKWPFMPAEPLHNDLYVGVDALNHVAGFTFFYPAEGKCHFADYPIKQPEKISKREMEKAVYEQLGLLLQDCTRPPRSIVFIRDGNSYGCERSGAGNGLKRLADERCLSGNLRTGTVEVHKKSAIPLRLLDTQLSEVRNPSVGSPYVLNTKEGFICNTGYPFRLKGTVRPLHLKIVDGALDIELILEDVFAQALLAWSAPDRCLRLPITISLCDLFLQPIASVAEEDDDEDLEDDEEELAEEMSTASAGRR